MQQTTLWLGLAIVATVAYHVVFKLTPATVNPFLSLFVSYSLVALVFLGILLSTGGADGAAFNWRGEFALLNWTAIALRIGRTSGPMLAAEPVEASCNRGADGRSRATLRAEPLPAAVVRPVNLCI